MSIPHCDMTKDCTNPVTHIGSKGYIYCAEHVPCRRGIEGCRKMRKWEIALLAEGKPLPSYKPIRKPVEPVKPVEASPVKAECWLWPDHAIGKRESRRLREEHNATVQQNADLLEALRGLFAECTMIHTRWGEGSNQREADAAIARAKALVDGLSNCQSST